jgi:predicted HAD superfamily Cof-like phosphohydrolase
MAHDSPAALVREFHETFDIPVADAPRSITRDRASARQCLIDEEVGELAEAVASERLDRIAHELADVVYVAYGTAASYGIDLDAVIAEVHRANMTKLDAQGRPVRRADGKILKGPNYRPPDVLGVLAPQQGERQSELRSSKTR